MGVLSDLTYMNTAPWWRESHGILLLLLLSFQKVYMTIQVGVGVKFLSGESEIFILVSGIYGTIFVSSF